MFRRTRAMYKFGSDLLSHFYAVPSALAGLTSLFGMGRGGAPPLKLPEFGFPIPELSGTLWDNTFRHNGKEDTNNIRALCFSESFRAISTARL
jgi:hypothetical protein